MEKFRLVFWMNMISPLQMPYIEELVCDSRVLEVIVNASEEISSARQQLGWNERALSENLRININPSEVLVEKIFGEKKEISLHFFSGIRGFEFVYKVFLMSLKFSLRRGIITEMPLTFYKGCKNGRPLFLHKLRFYMQDYKYIKDIEYIYTIGSECYDYYSSLNKHWKVIPFVYCTDLPDFTNIQGSSDKLQFIFVGNMTTRKNPFIILKAIERLNEQFEDKFEMKFIGQGELDIKLKNYSFTKNLSNVSYLGVQKRSSINSFLKESDILILPSKHDGWGAVINEALLLGCHVICSDKCGAKDLVDNSNGIVFSEGSVNELERAMLTMINNVDKIRSNRENVRIRSIRGFSPKVVSKYFLDSIETREVTLPWKF